MIKRRFYRQEHGERDEGSDSSSSSSDSDIEAQSSDASEGAAEEEQEEDPHHELSDRVNPQIPSPSSSSGYESEHSSADELDADSSGLAVDDEIGSGFNQYQVADCHKKEIAGMVEKLVKDDTLPDDVGRCILKCKSVFKCRLCPKIVCLNEDSLKAHLKSKRHARSEKLLSNGRLKHILNSDGEEEVLEEDGETHAERHARILALAQPTHQEKPKKKAQGRQRQRLRSKRKKERKKQSAQETGQNAKRRRQNV